MDATMEQLCAEKHKNIETKFEVNDKRLHNHGDRLDKLEGGQVRTETIVNNLCEQIKQLIEAMQSQQKEQKECRHVVFKTTLSIAGTIILVLVGFVIWYIQSLPII